MSQETKIELGLLLPRGNECEPCLERLEQRIQAYRGIVMAHLDQEGEAPRFCIHYDPNLVTPAEMVAALKESGTFIGIAEK